MSKMTAIYYVDDQHQSWMAADKFSDVPSFVPEFEDKYEEASDLGGLQMNDVAKCLMFLVNRTLVTSPLLIFD